MVRAASSMNREPEGGDLGLTSVLLPLDKNRREGGVGGQMFARGCGGRNPGNSSEKLYISEIK